MHMRAVLKDDDSIITRQWTNSEIYLSGLISTRVVHIFGWIDFYIINELVVVKNKAYLWDSLFSVRGERPTEPNNIFP